MYNGVGGDQGTLEEELIISSNADEVTLDEIFDEMFEALWPISVMSDNWRRPI